jgi:hypothetical protein
MCDRRREADARPVAMLVAADPVEAAGPRMEEGLHAEAGQPVGVMRAARGWRSNGFD